MRRVLSTVVGVLVALSAAPAAAQREVNVERFTPPMDRYGFLGFNSTYAPGPGRYNFGLVINYSKHPLTVRNLSGGSSAVVRHRLGGNFYGQVGIGGRFSVGLDLPVVFWQNGRAEDLRDGGPELASGAAGDPRLVLRYRVFGRDSRFDPDGPEGEGIAVEGSLTVPVGLDDAFANEASPVSDLRLLADFHILGPGIGIMLNWRHRFEDVRIGEVTFEDELGFGVALKVPIPWVPGMLAQLGVRGAFDARFGPSALRAIEGELGLSFTAGDVFMTAAVGTGFTDGVGTPAIRGVFIVDWSPPRGDADGDGILDGDDQCVHLAEDEDGFEDDDGCLDPDNDSDFVPDEDDRCRDEAAEPDRDADEDGCTDEGAGGGADADGDGVADGADQCAGEAEDRDEHADEDGCPDPDNDSDTVLDANDRCPNEAEDRDSFEDEDGCPDPDNDGDARPDGDDGCPTEAEDADGTEDQDGCPDPDDDRDGVRDGADRCPQRAESINGVEDEDGCPDRGGSGLWAATGEGDAVRLTGRIAWRADVLAPRSNGSVAQLAMHLTARWPHRFQIAFREAPTPGQTTSLTQALVRNGVPEARFTIATDPAVAAGQVVVTRAP